MRRFVFAAFSILFVSCLATGPAWAQQPQQQLQVLKLSKTELKGKVVGVAPGGFDMATDDGTRWSVSIDGKMGNLRFDRKSDIIVHGKGGTGLLAPGMSVAFFAKADKKNKLQGDVAGVKIFTPAADTQYGLFSSLPVADLSPPGEKPEQPTDLKEVQVYGKVVGLRNNDLTVAVPGGSLKAKLSDTCEVVLETGDFSFVRPGDLVTTEVMYGENTLAVGIKAEFEKSQSLGGEAKPARKPIFGRPPVEKPAEKATDKGAEKPAAKEVEKAAEKKE